MPGSEPFFGVPGFQVGRSLRFNDDDSARLNRIPQTAGNRRTFTYSVWFKLGNVGSSVRLFTAQDGSGTPFFTIDVFQDGDSDIRGIRVNSSANSDELMLITNGRLRDIAAWYHLVVAVDTTQGTASNRAKIYLNGTQLTDFATETYPDQNYQTPCNNTIKHNIGSKGDGGGPFDGYMSEINFIDGTALTPSYFGDTNEVTNQWVPTKYSGAYGTNGFYLPFKGYGIAAATGGSVATDGDYKVHSFTSNGTFEVTSITNTDPSLTGAATAEIEYLIIGGGGAGAGNSTSANVGGAGGGGAGAYRPGSALLTAQTYAVVVGAGGTGATYAANPAGDQGDDSSAFGITAEGGGPGGTYGYPVTSYGDNGSGGGGQGKSDNSAHAGATGGLFGNDGGDGHAGGTAGDPNYGAGGGGGSSAVGADGSTTAGGAGGAGTASSITGSSVTRAGGGGGSTKNNQGTQGAGGSGGGGAAAQTNGGDATANTGSGGGGAHNSGSAATGGDGGSGIVIIRYKFQ